MPPFLPTAPATSWTVDDFLPIQEELGEDFESTLRSSVGDDRYGGWWIDRTRVPSVLTVAVVGATSQDQDALRSATGLGARLSVSPFEIAFSYDELRACKQAMLEAEPAIPLQGGMFSVDPLLNRVSYTSLIPDHSVIANALASGACTEHVFVWRSAVFEFTHATRLDYPPHEGGLRVSFGPPNSPTRYPCSTAFTATGSGEFWGLSAGHCAFAGYSVYDGRGSSRGYVDKSTRMPLDCGDDCYRNSDSLRFEIQASHASRLIMTGLASPQHRSVKAPRYSAAELKPGTMLCFSGASSGIEGCGYLRSDGDEVEVKEGARRYRVWCVEKKAKDGDSGAPWYNIRSDGSAKPAGIHSGTSYSPASGKRWACFTHIGYAEQALGVTVLYQ